MATTAATAPPVRLTLEGLAATEALARRIAACARPGDVIALWGPLGAGKTAFARAFIAACAEAEGAKPEEVPSPTFTLVQTYPFARFTVHHFDLYRVSNAVELNELGFEDALGGVSLIEWPERGAALLPADRLDIALAPGNAPETRMAEITPHGSWRLRIRADDLTRN